jgi:protein kinase A
MFRPPLLNISTDKSVVQGPVVPHLRHPGDTRYFDQYNSSEPSADEGYSEEMCMEYDMLFESF